MNNAIFNGEKLSVSLADPQSAKQTNVILMKQRNGQPNARFKGGKLSASLSVSHADPQSAKQTNAIIINETKQWTTKCKILMQKAERVT